MGQELSEKELQNRIAEYLRKYFFVSKECWSTDKKYRIDLILLHKRFLSEYQYPIGIEIKIDQKKKGKDMANWLKQATNYSKVKFEPYGLIMVAAYPQLSGKYLEEGVDVNKHKVNERGGEHHNVNTFLGQFNIGELQRYRHWNNNEYLRIVFKGFPIWDEYGDKFRENNYMKVCSQLK